MTKPEAIKLVEKQVEDLYIMAEKKHNKSFPRPKVVVKANMGTKAGQIHYWYDGRPSVLEINEYFLLHHKTSEDMFKDTLPHEVAHDITYRVHGFHCDAHGYQWQNIMLGTFSINPTRCHNYGKMIGDLRDAMTGRVFIYVCPCCGKEFPKTAYIHNCITRGDKWFWHSQCGDSKKAKLKFSYQYK